MCEVSKQIDGERFKGEECKNQRNAGKVIAGRGGRIVERNESSSVELSISVVDALCVCHVLSWEHGG